MRQVEDAAIRDVARMQQEIGLQGVTDGEFRRGSWHMDFLYQIGGVGKTDQSVRLQFRNEAGAVEAALGGFRIGGKLRLEEPIFGEDFAYLKSVAPTGTTPKLTIPSPSMLHYRGGRAAIDSAVYPDMDQFWDDLAQVYADEIAALHRLGCTYLQLDDTSLAYLNDPAQRAYVNSIGGDGDTQHLTNIKIINAALAGKPDGMTVCTHMCRGNFRSSWMAEGGYDHVAEALFGELAVDGFFLEYDDSRSGGFEPLRFVPRGSKRVVLGLVTSKRAALESKDELKAAHRRGGEIRATGAAVPEPAMRLFVDRRGQRADDRTNKTQSSGWSSKLPARFGANTPTKGPVRDEDNGVIAPRGSFEPDAPRLTNK